MRTTRAFRKTSIKDVARHAGVSTTTVSYFVSGRENVCAADTAQRIRAAIDELQYTPSSLTRGLRQQATRTLGVCLYSPVDPGVRFGNLFFERLWRGIWRESGLADYALLHYPPSVWNGQGVQTFLDGRVDGLLLQFGSRAVAAARAGMPTVLLARALDLPENCGAAYADEAQTVTLALDHLRALGHRRIAHLAGPVRSAAEDGRPVTETVDDVAVLRLAAYSDRMRAEGLYDTALIGHADSWYQSERVTEILRTWNALPEPPTAVFCANDALAVAALDAARELSWCVPDVLSIVGVDDSADARDASVPITSVAVPLAEVGREGVRALLRLMNGEPIEMCRVAVPVTEIVVRGSTAAVPAARGKRL